ncbi:MAG: metalloregulator ArsR/SmtB family transcription factor [Acidobacteria bacterium]|nr:metalloregulator ArsR/SmtB family transcription factor [Acidobacteriota bacterium]MCZ6727022.1 metalloregulator ArsR/SmtB family transcription factor [Acidobacteriota bacterium]
MALVFQAVADPTRRELLARLRSEGALSLGELAAPLAMSRQAVSKHLGILQEAGLIEIEWRGRVKLHRLDPEPLRVVDAWLVPYAEAWDRRLERLRKHLKENE